MEGSDRRHQRIALSTKRTAGTIHRLPAVPLIGDPITKNDYFPRTDRTTRKATAEQVMELSRNLPLTRSVPGRAVENATPEQLGFLSDLFRAENASRAEPRTGPSARTGVFWQVGVRSLGVVFSAGWAAGFPQDDQHSWGRPPSLFCSFVGYLVMRAC